MVIKKFSILLISVLSVSTLCFQCKEKIRFDCAETIFNFEIGVKEYPGKNTFHVGDTMWFEIYSPDILKDLITNNLINYNGVENLGSVIGVQQLDSNNNFIIKAFNRFSHVLVKGKEVTNNMDPELFREYLFEDKKGYYQFKYAFVAHDTGIFRISFY